MSSSTGGAWFDSFCRICSVVFVFGCFWLFSSLTVVGGCGFCVLLVFWGFPAMLYRFFRLSRKDWDQFHNLCIYIYSYIMYISRWRASTLIWSNLYLVDRKILLAELMTILAWVLALKFMCFSFTKSCEKHALHESLKDSVYTQRTGETPGFVHDVMLWSRSHQR